MALLYGADAVYLGGAGFSMRASAKGFAGEALHAAVKKCHRSGALAYVTCNTLPRPDETGALEGFLKTADEAGADALIVADIGVMAAARRIAPNLPLHMSTQTGIVNHLSATALYEMGASRVILARELNIDEIRAIRAQTPPALELEMFVHGAMCLSFSGRCVLSDYLAGRDANRGECAQPCRWGWSLMEEKRPGEFYPVFEDEGGSYILNAKDLCLIEHLQLLRAAGVSSFKVEGRMKSSFYTAVVTGAYRAAIDSLPESAGESWQAPVWAVRETGTVSHREYCSGFLFGRPDNAQCQKSGGYLREWDIAGIVTGYENGRIILSQRGKFSPGDEIEAIEPGGPPFSIDVCEMFDGDGGAIACAPHSMMEVRLPYHRALRSGSILRKRKVSADA